MAKRTSTTPLDLFDNFLQEAVTVSVSNSDRTLGVVEFAEQIIFNGELSLYGPQATILRAFYNEELTEEDKELLLSWATDEPEFSRTTFVADRNYSHLVLEAGRGAGKSTLISILCLYEFYLLINLESPGKHYGLAPGSPIAIIAIAQSQDQVKQTLFKAIRGYAENSAYFSNLVKKGEVELGMEEIRCEHKKISIFAKHTNSKALVGYSIKCLIVDEAARFEMDAYGKSKADGIWGNIGKGTRRFGVEGRKIAISSAWEPGDYIEKLYFMAERSVDVLAFRLKTWQVNLNPNNSELVIKSSEDYITDPVAAATEFEGIRASKQGTFFLPDKVDAAFVGSSACDAARKAIDIGNGDSDTRHYTGLTLLRVEPKIELISFAHCDYGIKKDAAALALASPTKINGKWGVVVDIILAWQPYRAAHEVTGKSVHRLVSIPNCEEVFLHLARTRKVHTFSFDSYNSQGTIQKLHAAGINTIEMSTATVMQNRYFNTTKLLLNEGSLILPKDTLWSTTAQLELKHIIELPGGKITHSVYGKDISDAICNAVYNCYQYMNRANLVDASSTLPMIATVNSNNSRSALTSNTSTMKLRANSGSALKKLRGK